MAQYRGSRYNFFFQAGRDCLGYNSFSNSFASIRKEDFEIVEKILKAPNADSNFNGKMKRIRSTLIKGGFLIDRNIDELELLRLQNRIARFSRDHLSLTIAPTLNCNFKCGYCFEKHKNVSFSKKDESDLLNFIEKKFEDAHSFGALWFGGEPLIQLGSILRLSSAIMELCRKHNVHFFKQGIITNGYLLSRKHAKELFDSNFDHAQITIDGPPEVHDKRRKLKNGEGTFDRIVSNIMECHDILRISVRINLDSENMHKTDELFRIFRENKIDDKVFFYFGRVMPVNEGCADISDCIGEKDFASFILERIKKTQQVPANIIYPKSYKKGLCGADKLNGYVITPRGNMFKCWCETCFDKSNSVGSYASDELEPYQMKNLIQYLNWDPLQIGVCSKCKFLPICGGSCPYYHQKSLSSCTQWKYYLKEILIMKSKEMQSKKMEVK